MISRKEEDNTVPFQHKIKKNIQNQKMQTSLNVHEETKRISILGI